MTTLATPLTTGDRLPALDLIGTSGDSIALDALIDTAVPTVLYAMRTSTCPVCHQHLRHLARLITERRLTADSIVVLVPGGPAEARAVAARHPALAGRIVASETAHAAMGLFVRGGLQQSGTFVVQGATVLYARVATVPLGSFDARETMAALER